MATNELAIPGKNIVAAIAVTIWFQAGAMAVVSVVSHDGAGDGVDASVVVVVGADAPLGAVGSVAVGVVPLGGGDLCKGH